MVVNKDTIRQSVYDEIRVLIVASITDKIHPSKPGLRAGTAWWFGENSKRFISSTENRSNYPLGVIGTPIIDSHDGQDLHHDVGIVEIQIPITVYHNSNEQLAEVQDEVRMILRDAKSTLSAAGLQMDVPWMEADDPGFVMRGDIPVHFMTQIFNYRFGDV